jgi:molybdopterin synthase sulfur carrier subunit
VPVQVLFLGQLQDLAGTPATAISVRAGDTIGSLIQSLNPALAAVLTSDRVRVALNGALTTNEAILSPGDEIAFLPPVSGG